MRSLKMIGSTATEYHRMEVHKKEEFCDGRHENFGVIGTIPKMKIEGLPCVTYSP